jgi:hypothetical protein
MIKVLLVWAAIMPSVSCFFIALHLILHDVKEGWGWFLIIGTLALDLPYNLLQRIFIKGIKDDNDYF